MEDNEKGQKRFTGVKKKSAGKVPGRYQKSTRKVLGKYPKVQEKYKAHNLKVPG